MVPNRFICGIQRYRACYISRTQLSLSVSWNYFSPTPEAVMLSSHSARSETHSLQDLKHKTFGHYGRTEHRKKNTHTTPTWFQYPSMRHWTLSLSSIPCAKLSQGIKVWLLNPGKSTRTLASPYTTDYSLQRPLKCSYPLTHAGELQKKQNKTKTLSSYYTTLVC